MGRIQVATVSCGYHQQQFVSIQIATGLLMRRLQIFIGYHHQKKKEVHNITMSVLSVNGNTAPITTVSLAQNF